MLGEETLPGDPLEFFTPEDMLDGYYRILNSVMLNLDDANQKAVRDSNGLRKALKELRKRSKEALKKLDYLEKLAKKGFAEMRVKSNGVIVFCFPEFMEETRSSDFEDF